MYQTIVNVSCVITHKDTWKHMWDYRNNHIDVQSKISYILSHTILHSMNATGNYLVRNSWGFRNASTGLYDGMVGDVQRHKVELGGTGAFTTIDRIEFADYIAPIYKSKASFMFRAPPLSSVSNVLTLPFTKQVWMASFFLSILICTVMYIISKWEWSEDDFKITFEGKSDVLLPSFIESFVFSLGAICQQGCKVEPKSVAGRISALVSLLIFLFLYTSYSANIVALLQSTSDSINTIDDLLNSRIQLGMELMPYNHYFKLSYGVRKQLYDTKIEPKGSSPNFLDIDAGMKKVREEFYGFYVENSRAYKVVSETFLEHEKCSLRGVPYINFGDTWITMAKKSSYKKLVKYGFRKAFESGIQNREIRKLYVSKPVCHTSESSFGSVGLKDSYYAFVIFAIGIGTALMLLILEMVINKKQQELITTWKSVQNYVNQNVIEKLNQI
ncbi:ionotropic receptor 75a-like [Onthophagus taurus]|uniref:ionotropic receptor 75a-like n=1 Tax=Onthophagus taurus TaxID=166361 RepID=UPI0039BDEA4F